MGNMRFKVGDRVRIKSLDWYNENKDEYGTIIFSTESGDYSFTKEDVRFCGRVVTIAYEGEGHYLIAEDDRMYFWIDEMIEGLVEEENKPNFKVGDEVRIKGTDIGGTIESVIRGQLIVNSKGSKIPAWPEDVVLMKYVENEIVHNKWTGLKVELELSKTVIGVNSVESLHGERFMSGFVKAIIPPEGYQFVDENGNVINATKIVLEKKKKEYPKTYGYCCDTLECCSYNVGFDRCETSYDDTLHNKLLALRKLIICRDAYWKVYGEENGLGKPWEPDWSDASCSKYIIDCFGGEICKGITAKQNTTFAFPTEEIRNAFKENFDKDLEICKELL